VKAAYAGVPGAFGHEACLAFLPEHEPVAIAGFGEVVTALLAGQVNCGILPLENNAAGAVQEVQALLATQPIEIVSEHVLPVRMHLMALPGSDFTQIHTIVSHPVALKQCARTLARLELGTEEAPNTAIAARDLDQPSKAVLASEAAAEAYGLTILLRDVQDREDNATRFAIIARRG
jgi:prephenate dehydratase